MLSLSIDSWMSITNKIFIAITRLGITTDWHMEQFLLEVIPVNKDKTGACITDVVEEMLKQWGIGKEQIICITRPICATLFRRC